MFLRRLRRRSPQSSPWTRAGRTLALGAALGCAGALLTLAGIAVVRRSSGPAPILADDVPAFAIEPARAALSGIADGPVWRPVVRCGTPWGETVRLRPFVAGIEVRGCDCVVDAFEAIPERDPRTVDWPRLQASARAVTGRLSSAGGLARALRGAPAAAPGDTAGTSALGAEPGGTAASLFFRLGNPGTDPDAAAWDLQAEVGVSETSAFRSAPWSGLLSGTAANPGTAATLVVTLDPATLSVLEARDGRIYASEPAEAEDAEGAEGTGLLFDPNPVVTSGRRDLRDGDRVDLWRIRVALPRLDGTGRLRGRWIESSTDRPPEAREPGLVFDYPSYDPRFEQGMSYLHGDRALDRVDGLGYRGLFPAPLRIRAHGTADDNSWYSRVPREVVLGDGGVDDGEDADIILHEVGHAIHDALAPGFGGGDALAISEGFCDFWAASLTGDPCIGDWDAVSYSPPCLRRVDDGGVYPVALSGNPHEDGRIWSTLLWDLRSSLGQDRAEQLALGALLESGTAPSWQDARDALERAARRLGIPEAPVREALARRGLAPRVFEVVLERDGSQRFHLIAPARFLGTKVEEVTLCGDGRIVFSADPADPPIPDGPDGPDGPNGPELPADAPEALASGVPEIAGLFAPDSLRLRITGSIGQVEGSFRLEWLAGRRSLARTVLEWDPVSGSCAWTCLDLRTDARIPAAIALSSSPVDSLPLLRLEEVPDAGIGGLTGFRCTVSGAPPSLIGARFLATQDGAGTFRLDRTSQGIGEAPRIVLRARPNPFRSETSVALFVPVPGDASLGIYDVAGRRVRLINAALPAGLTEIVWDGRDGSGRAVAAGMYWARAECNGERGSVRLLRIR